LGSGDQETLAGVGARVFVRGDPNLANCLWDGREVRLIDFEYSGWGERAFDLADLTEHVQSRNTPDETRDAFVAGFGLTAGEWGRFRASQRLMACFWVLRLWPREDGEDAGKRERFGAQVVRLRGLV
jgi:thiamine kinase-like enzyme